MCERPMSGYKEIGRNSPHRQDRCTSTDACSRGRRPLVVASFTTPLRAAIGLQKALPRGEGRSCRRRSDKRGRLRQDDSAECCCSHHPCSKRLQLAHRQIDDLVTRSRDFGRRDGRTYLSAQTAHLSAFHGWAASRNQKGIKPAPWPARAPYTSPRTWTRT